MATVKFGQFVRQLNTSAVRNALVTPPIPVYGIEGRYAHALYSAATKEKKLDVVEKELKGFQTLIEKDTKFLEFLSNPVLKRQEKRAVIDDVMKKQNYSKLIGNLVGAMAENSRLNKLTNVMNTFGKLMSAHRGEVLCSVTTAKALDNASTRELKDALQGFLKKGESLQLEMKIDPSIIGGMIVSIGDKYVDMSMASKMKTYTDLIKQAV